MNSFFSYARQLQTLREGIKTDEQKEIWSPQIGIRTRMVSQNEQGLGFGVYKTSGWRWPWVSRKVDLTTKVKCPMNFQNFPFDNHSCKLEVSWYRFFHSNSAEKIVNIKYFILFIPSLKMKKMKQ